MVPLTRGSTMIWRSIITAIARVTASMSALTKFTVTGALERSAVPWPAGGEAARRGWAAGDNGVACGVGCGGTACGCRLLRVPAAVLLWRLWLLRTRRRDGRGQ